MNNNASSTTLCQPSCGLSCGYYFSSGFVISDTVYSSATHGALYNAASRVIVDGGRKVLQTAALGGMLVQNLVTPAEAKTVSPGQSVTLYSGSTYNNTLVSGYYYISSGVAYASSAVLNVYGTTNSTILSNLGYENILSGGVANGTNIKYNGIQQVFSSGTASSTIVNSGGCQNVVNGGKAFGTIVNSGASQYVSGGGAWDTIVSSGGIQELRHTRDLNYYTDVLGTIVDGGRQVVDGYTTATRTIVSRAGVQIVSSGGSASRTTVGSGGEQIVLRSGVARYTIVESGGFQVISSGGSAINNIVFSGAYQIASKGAVYNNMFLTTGTVLNAGQTQTVGSGSADYGAVIKGGSQTILSGGIALKAEVSNGGKQYVYIGGTASGTKVSSGGELHLGYDDGGYSYETGTAVGTLIDYGDEYIHSRGFDVSAVISNGGWQIIYSGGSASNAHIKDYGRQYLGDEDSLGGNAVSTVISNTGMQIIYDSGVATGTVISTGGAQYVFENGTASNTTINGGTQYVNAGANISGYAIINFGGEQHLFTSASNVIVNSGVQFVSSGGLAVSTTVNNSGGWLQVEENGSARNAVINSGASMYVSAGASTALNVINSGGTMNTFGVDSMTVIREGGIQGVHNLALSTSICSGGAQSVFAGGIAAFTAVDEDAMLTIDGGYASSAIVKNYGSMGVRMGSAIGTTLNSGAGLWIEDSGAAVSTVVNEDAFIKVFSGGETSNTVVSSGGAEFLFSGVANNTVVDGGYQYISSGSIASGTVLNNAASQVISSGGAAYDTNINKGVVDVYGPAVIGGSTFINSTGYIVLNFENDSDLPYTLNMDNVNGNEGTIYFANGNRLKINSSFSGNVNVWVNNLGNEDINASPEGFKMIEFASTVDDSDITGTFSGSYDRGAYVYTLQKGTLSGEGNDYYLRSNGEYTGIYKSMLTVPLMNFAALKVSMASLNNHITSLRDMNNVETTNGIWYRGNYSNLTLSKFGDIDIKYQGMDAGWEWKMFRKTDDLEKGPRGFYMGVTASHTGLSMQDKKKEKSGSFADGGSLIAGGVYGTYVSDSGFFWDFSGKYGQNSIEMTHQTADDDLLSYNPKRNVMIGGAELGWAFSLGQNKTGLTFIPKAGYQFMSADKAEIEVKDRRANKIGMAAFGGAKYSAMAGTLAISYIPKDKTGFYIEPFAEATYSSMSGNEEVSYAGVTEKSEIDKSMLEVYAGFDMTFSRNFSLHLAGSMMKSESIKSVGGDLGLTFKFGGKNAETF